MKHFLLLLFASVLLTQPLTAAADDSLKPWEAWQRGCLAYEDGESARESGDFLRALSVYREALRHFRSVRRDRPEWNRRAIDERIAMCEKAIAESRRLLGRDVSPASPEPVPPPEPGVRPGSAVQPEPAAPSASLDLLQSEAEEYKRRFFAAQAELEQLKRGSDRARATMEELTNLMRDYRVLEEKNQLLEARITQLETQPAAQPAADAGRRLVELRINLENALRKLKLANSEAESHKQESDQLRDRNSDLTREAVRLRSETARLQQEVEQLRPIRQRADQERNHFLVTQEEWKKQLESARRLTESRDREIAELNERLKTMAAGEQVDLTVENQRLRDEARTLRTESATVAAENVQFRNEAREAKIQAAELGNAVQSLNDRLTRLDRENRMMLEQLEKRSSAAAIADRELVTLRTANREMEEQIAAAAEREKTFEDRLAAGLRADRAAAASFREERDDLRRQLDAAKLEKTSLTASQDELRQQLADTTRQYQELRTEFLELKAASLSAAEAGKKIPRLEAEKKSLTAEAATLRQRIAGMELALKEANQRAAGIPDLQNKLAAAEKSAAAARSLRQQLARLEAENQELRDRPVPTPSPTAAPAAPAAPAASSAEIQKYRAAAAAAEAENAAEVAIWNYRQILQSLPRDPEANHGLGRQLFARGDNEAALPALQTAHLARPANLAWRVAYAAALTRAGKPGNAAALLTAVGELPDDFTAALELGRALRLADRGDEAAAPLRRAAALRPNDPAAQLELALLLAADHPRDAARHYENAKKCGATPVPALEKSLGQLVNQRAELADFLAAAAAEAEKNDDHASAAWYYAELVKADPDEPGHRWRAVQYLLLLQQPEAAELMLDKHAGPADDLLRAAICILQKRPADAEKLLTTVTEPAALPLLPALDRQLGDSAAAVKLRSLIAR